MKRPLLTLFFLSMAAFASDANAMPVAPAAVCQLYPDSPFCSGGMPACTLCHTNSEVSTVAWNVFGADVKAELPTGTLSTDDFLKLLPGALEAVSMKDSDKDGFANQDEIVAGTLPGDDRSHPESGTCPSDADLANLDYPICHYGPDFVFRKISLDFCGYSPSFAEVEAFAALTDAEKLPALDAELAACIKSDFWRGKNGVLWQLAHRKIRPVGTLKDGEDPGAIPIADYYDDYDLFAYTQIDDHDARDVLLAQYYVTRTGLSDYQVVPDLPGTQEDVDMAHRAGLMTSRWNLLYNVMFTALPRTAAAQAYRAFMGFDIARLEGLYPVAGEPKDYDNKGVTQMECAGCHSTLDPLTYPFKNYDGFQAPLAAYNPTRIEDNYLYVSPKMKDIPESGYILGKPVKDLREWATVAANSDEFAAATVKDYWKLLLGAPPGTADTKEFEAAWKELEGKDKYSVDKMLHNLIKTEAYGAP
jgi:hypothetical protein